jgi:gliding motility-associated-like protein
MVYWGFSAATGGSVNLQQFCTALNPSFNIDLLSNRACIGTPITFTNTSQSFTTIASVFWDLGDNTTTTAVVPPPHTYANIGTYEVKLAITGMDGCKSDTLKKIISIGDYPVAAFEAFDTCSGLAPRIIDNSVVDVGNLISWDWKVEGSSVSNLQAPALPEMTAGSYNIELQVVSDHGCTSSNNSLQNIIIKPVPEISMLVENGCVDIPVILEGTQIDNGTQINVWQWNFNGVNGGAGQQISQTFEETGVYDVLLTAEASNGCSGIANAPLFINRAFANAGRDTIILKDVPFQLQGSGGGLFEWTPTLGLDNWTIANPITTLQDDITYTLKVTTNEGCIDSDQIKIQVFKGSFIYVPTGFTPDGNGLNDQLRPSYHGIKQLDYFTVFNRWGERIFFTKNLTGEWDGMYKGTRVASGVYVWMVRAIDYVGKIYELKGTTTIIR